MTVPVVLFEVFAAWFALSERIEQITSLYVICAGKCPRQPKTMISFDISSDKAVVRATHGLDGSQIVPNSEFRFIEVFFSGGERSCVDSVYANARSSDAHMRDSSEK